MVNMWVSHGEELKLSACGVIAVAFSKQIPIYRKFRQRHTFRY